MPDFVPPQAIVVGGGYGRVEEVEEEGLDLLVEIPVMMQIFMHPRINSDVELISDHCLYLQLYLDSTYFNVTFMFTGV